MKKMLLAFLGCLVLGSLAWADNLSIKAPVNDRGVAVHPFYGGYKYKRMAGTTEVMICTAPCILADLIMGTGDPAGYIALRDTGAVGDTATGNIVLPPIAFSGVTTSRQHVIAFPIRATYGFAIDILAGAGAEEVTAVYMDLD